MVTFIKTGSMEMTHQRLRTKFSNLAFNVKLTAAFVTKEEFFEDI